jgi:DNA-directed RNA polymerase III subunit RPC6
MLMRLQNKGKKVYMLAELKPSKEHTGGAWYTDQTFDAEFVNVLKQQCVQFVVRQVRILDLERE